MSDEILSKSDEINAKLRAQIELQQAEERLRHVRDEILNLNNQIRKHQQDYQRAKITLDTAEAKLKLLKAEEFDLNQNTMRQRRAYIQKK